jgi:hypothetical protein
MVLVAYIYLEGWDQEDQLIWDQPRQKSSWDLISEKKMLGVVVHACHPSYSEGWDQEDHSSS